MSIVDRLIVFVVNKLKSVSLSGTDKRVAGDRPYTDGEIAGNM